MGPSDCISIGYGLIVIIYLAILNVVVIVIMHRAFKIVNQNGFTK